MCAASMNQGSTMVLEMQSGSQEGNKDGHEKDASRCTETVRSLVVQVSTLCKTHIRALTTRLQGKRLLVNGASWIVVIFRVKLGCLLL